MEDRWWLAGSFCIFEANLELNHRGVTEEFKLLEGSFLAGV